MKAQVARGRDWAQTGVSARESSRVIFTAIALPPEKKRSERHNLRPPGILLTPISSEPNWVRLIGPWALALPSTTYPHSLGECGLEIGDRLALEDMRADHADRHGEGVDLVDRLEPGAEAVALG